MLVIAVASGKSSDCTGIEVEEVDLVAREVVCFEVAREHQRR
jgi:hypothetical protein